MEDWAIKKSPTLGQTELVTGALLYFFVKLSLFRILARRVIEATEQNIEIFPVKQ